MFSRECVGTLQPFSAYIPICRSAALTELAASDMKASSQSAARPITTIGHGPDCGNVRRQVGPRSDDLHVSDVITNKLRPSSKHGIPAKTID